MTSNGIIHVIDKVLMPPVQEVDPFEGVNCAVTIGVGASGLAYSIPAATIDVGETVCWSWTDESMAHNVKEISGPGSTTYVENGITSGESMKTVYFTTPSMRKLRSTMLVSLTCPLAWSVKL